MVLAEVTGGHESDLGHQQMLAADGAEGRGKAGGFSDTVLLADFTQKTGAPPGSCAGGEGGIDQS